MGMPSQPETRTHWPGPFLSLDGPDGTGKTTQCRLLAESLRGRGYAVTQCVDPGGTAAGDVIRGLVLDRRQAISLPCETLLFMASRAQLLSEVIRPALEKGGIIVSDRFSLATVVYQGYAGGLDLALLREVGRLATQGVEPDLTVVLDMPVEEAFARKHLPPDRLESRDVTFHHKVREGFLAEARLRPDRVRVVDARLSVQEVHRQVLKEVVRVLETGSRA